MDNTGAAQTTDAPSTATAINSDTTETTADPSSSSSSSAFPVITVPPSVGAPYLQKSDMPEGTLFIAVGSVLGAIGLAVLVWRALVALSVRRSVHRSAMLKVLAGEGGRGVSIGPRRLHSSRYDTRRRSSRRRRRRRRRSGDGVYPSASGAPMQRVSSSSHHRPVHQSPRRSRSRRSSRSRSNSRTRTSRNYVPMQQQQDGSDFDTSSYTASDPTQSSSGTSGSTQPPRHHHTSRPKRYTTYSVDSYDSYGYYDRRRRR